MKISGAIFDMDGTLTDSMPVWRTIGSTYLKRRGISPREDIDRRFCSMSVFEAVRIFQSEYGLSEPEDKLCSDITDMIYDIYENDVLLKNGAKEILCEFYEKGIPACVATATDRPMVEAVFKRCGIFKYVKEIFTCREIGVGKKKPDIYLAASRAMKTRPKHTAVFEDATHAAETAKRAGFYVVGLYDEASCCDFEKTQKIADVCGHDVGDFIGKFEKRKSFRDVLRK